MQNPLHLAALAAVLTPLAFSQNTDLLSLRLDGSASSGYSTRCSVDDAGRFVVFDSSDSELIANDTNGTTDIFLRDLATGETRGISSHAQSGEPSNGPCSSPVISGNGRYVVFESKARNLVPGDTNGRRDVYRADLLSGAIQRVSIDEIGVQPNLDCTLTAVSRNGEHVAFATKSSSLSGSSTHIDQAYWKDMVTGDLQLLSRNSQGSLADGDTWVYSLSDDGSTALLGTYSQNLAPQDNNGAEDLLLWKRGQSSLQLVTRGLSGGTVIGGAGYGALAGDGETVILEVRGGDFHPATSGQSHRQLYRYTVSTGGIDVLSYDSQGHLIDGDVFFLRMNSEGTQGLIVTPEQLSPLDTNATNDFYQVNWQGVPQYTPISMSDSGQLHTGATHWVDMNDNGAVVALVSGNRLTPDAHPTAHRQVYARKSGRAEMGLYGTGQGGGQGVPSLHFEHLPTLADLPSVVVQHTSSVPNPICILSYGLHSDASPALWGTQYTSPDRARRFVLTPGQNELPLGFTADMVPVGFTLHYQAIVQDPSAPNGLASSNGGWIRVGY